jgi:threonyl-tRNA synthetase
MVLAARRLFGFDIHLGVGPVIDDGFYQDFSRTFTPQELEAIESEMRRIIDEDIAVEMQVVPVSEAIDLFRGYRQPYKIELLENIKAFGTSRADREQSLESEELRNRNDSGMVSIYSFGEHVDLCRGPHVQRSGELRGMAFCLDRIAGAYWRGNEANPMLCRVYGLAFSAKEELASYLQRREEAKQRDHRKVGEDLELFFFHPTSPGMPYWLPKGVILKNTLIQFWRQYHQARNYQEIQSPLVNRRDLWEISGHWKHYHADMIRCDLGNQEEWALKPMNCANAMVVWKFKPRSYRDLPLRLSDTDILHRNERSGSLAGLFRARCFCQDDAHNFISEEQIASEIQEIFGIIKDFYGALGLLESVELYLSTRPDDFMGDQATWDRAEEELRSILAASQMKYGIKEKDGAFYGPKIDIHLRDSLGREWQCGTIQLDFQLPRNFELEYTDKDGSAKTPIVIHRVIYGSLERFIAIMIEHFAGRLPLWLAPVQVRLLPVKDGIESYVEDVRRGLSGVVFNNPVKHSPLRFEVDARRESLSRRVRDAEVAKIPVILICGPRDVTQRSVTLRYRGQDEVVPLNDIAAVLERYALRV